MFRKNISIQWQRPLGERSKDFIVSCETHRTINTTQMSSEEEAEVALYSRFNWLNYNCRCSDIDFHSRHNVKLWYMSVQLHLSHAKKKESTHNWKGHGSEVMGQRLWVKDHESEVTSQILWAHNIQLYLLFITIRGRQWRRRYPK